MMRPTLRFQAACLLALAAAADTALADRDALWKIIDGGCVPGFTAGQMPAPCTRLEMPSGRDQGWVLLKDRRGVLQYLLLPTARVPGIESPLLLKDETPNFFAQAWRARDLLDRLNGRPLPRNAVSLTVNPVRRRSQDQFHIHISCTRPELQAHLAAAQDSITTDWSALPGGWERHTWFVRRVDGDALESVNPIIDMAARVPGAAGDMGTFGVGVVAMTFSNGKPGFVLMATPYEPGDTTSGSAEHDIQDHDCTGVAAAPAAPASEPQRVDARVASEPAAQTPQGAP